MQGTVPRIVAVTILAIALRGLRELPQAPTWTFPPVPQASAGTGPEPSLDSGLPPAGPASGKIEVEAFDLGFKPAAVMVPAAGTVRGHPQQYRRRDPRHHLRRWDEDRGRSQRNGDGNGHGPGRRSHVHLLDPGS